jgi:hypothetical protein
MKRVDYFEYRRWEPSRLKFRSFRERDVLAAAYLDYELEVGSARTSLIGTNPRASRWGMF